MSNKSLFQIPSYLSEMGFNERILTITDFYEYCAFAGIEVFKHDTGDTFYGAFIPAIMTPTRTPLILLDKGLPDVPLRIAGFHEIGHYVLHNKSGIQNIHTFKGEDYCFVNICKKEYQAHAFAACALLPKPFLGSEKELERARKLSKEERREWRLKKVKELKKQYSEYLDVWLIFRLRVALTFDV